MHITEDPSPAPQAQPPNPGFPGTLYRALRGPLPKAQLLSSLQLPEAFYVSTHLRTSLVSRPKSPKRREQIGVRFLSQSKNLAIASRGPVATWHWWAAGLRPSSGQQGAQFSKRFTDAAQTRPHRREPAPPPTTDGTSPGPPPPSPGCDSMRCSSKCERDLLQPELWGVTRPHDPRCPGDRTGTGSGAQGMTLSACDPPRGCACEGGSELRGQGALVPGIGAVRGRAPRSGRGAGTAEGGCRMKESSVYAGPRPVRFPNTNPSPKRSSSVPDRSPQLCSPPADLRHRPRDTRTLGSRSTHRPA